MLEHLKIWLLAQANNQIFTGVAAAAVLSYVGFQVRAIPGRAWSEIKRFTTISMAVHSDDPMFVVMNRWATQQRFVTGSRALRLRTNYDDSEAGNQSYGRPIASAAPGSGDEDQGLRWLLSPAEGTHVCTYEGWPFVLSIDSGDGAPASSDGGNASSRKSMWKIEKLHITTAFKPAGWLHRVVDAACQRVSKEPKVNVYICGAHGGYHSSIQKRPRPISSIITAGDIANEMLADMRQFQQNAEWYIRRGVPWRRGYMLKGPPGTGKSSLIFALASELRAPIYVMNIADCREDVSVLEMLRNVPTGGIALFEDIDAAGLHRVDGATEKSHVSLSAMLNALDGVSAGDGRIVIMTSNNPEVLDPALVRPGRVDVQYTLDLFGVAEAHRMYNMFFPDAPFSEREEFVKKLTLPIQPAALQGMLLLRAQGVLVPTMRDAA